MKSPARQPRLRVVAVEPILLTVDLQRHAVAGGGHDLLDLQSVRVALEQQPPDRVAERSGLDQ